MITSASCCVARKREDVERRWVLAKPGSITPHTDFEAEIRRSVQRRRWPSHPFFNGYRPRVLLPHHRRDRCAANCRLTLNGDARRQRQNHGAAHVPIAMEDGLRFAIREGGRTVGAGVVSKIIK